MDPLRLVDWHIPEVRHPLQRRDTAFYALSVGLGQDPLDLRQLAFIDPGAPDLQALPSMALVLAYPGFWLGDPATGVDAAKVVHAEQAIELLGELPVEGMLVGRTRITGLVDGGADKGSWLYSERGVLREDGSPCAVLRQTHMLRGDGGFGEQALAALVERLGPAGTTRPAPPPVTEGTPVATLDLATRPEQALLYRLNGDTNPLHISPTVAARAGFERPILHGMCTFGLVAHALLRLACGYDATRMRGMSARFSRPVYPGETIRTELHAGGRFRARVVERDTIVMDQGQLTLA